MIIQLHIEWIFNKSKSGDHKTRVLNYSIMIRTQSYIFIAWTIGKNQVTGKPLNDAMIVIAESYIHWIFNRKESGDWKSTVLFNNNNNNDSIIDSLNSQ